MVFKLKDIFMFGIIMKTHYLILEMYGMVNISTNRHTLAAKVNPLMQFIPLLEK